MNGKIVSICFCGGCNPRIDRGGIAQAVKAHLLAAGCQVAFNQDEADCFILLSGCTANCAGRRQTTGGQVCIAIAGESIDALPVSPEQLVITVLEKVRSYYRTQDASRLSNSPA